LETRVSLFYGLAQTLT